MLDKRQNNWVDEEKEVIKTIQDENGFDVNISKSYCNKQKMLVTSTRGISQRDRHLMKDLLNLIPHSKKESKIDKHYNEFELKNLLKLSSCNNLMLFDNHDINGLDLLIGQIDGPSIKFKVNNIYTSKELKLTGNCLKNSRPILSFDKNFEENTLLKLSKNLWTNSFNTPKFHPKSKPFVDHVFNFSYCDNKIWFRNYQIFKNNENKEKIDLIEIGPRFSLEIYKIFEGLNHGKVLYSNSNILNVSVVKRNKKMELLQKIELKAKKNKKKTDKKESKMEDLLTKEEKLFE